MAGADNDHRGSVGRNCTVDDCRYSASQPFWIWNPSAIGTSTLRIFCKVRNALPVMRHDHVMGTFDEGPDWKKCSRKSGWNVAGGMGAVAFSLEFDLRSVRPLETVSTQSMVFPGTFHFIFGADVGCLDSSITHWMTV